MINYKPKPYLNWMPKYKKNSVVKIVATGQVAVVSQIVPEAGGIYYLLEGAKGAYHESEIIDVK